MPAELDFLNESYAVPGHVSFEAGPGGLPVAAICNAHAEARVCLMGGHVLSYALRGEPPVLWLSPNSAFGAGKPIRGGVPVCWPWFANQVDDSAGPPAANLPAHGFVRSLPWAVQSARGLPGGETELVLSVSDTPETLALWPHAFKLELEVTVGARLCITLKASNPGSQPYRYTGAFHPYFAVGDVHSIGIEGLDGVDYLDKTDGFKAKTQAGPLRFAGEVDFIFLNTAASLTVRDPQLRRAICIAKAGSRTTVVWNPFEKDALSADMGAGCHRQFFCAEPANAAHDVITVAPGGQAQLVMQIGTEPLP